MASRWHDMNDADAFDIITLAIWTVLFAAGPAVAAAMVVGVAIALLQALTQVQEATLTFIPKIIVMVVVLTVTAPFSGGKLFTLGEVIFQRIEKGYMH